MTTEPISEADISKFAQMHVEALARDLEESIAQARRLKREAEEARDAARLAKKQAEDIAQLPMNSPDPLIKVDCDNDVLLFVNPAAYNKYSDILSLGTKHPLLVDIKKVAEEAYGLGRSITREVIVGKIIYQQIVTPYLMAEEHTVTVYNYDITKLKEIEENLRRERANAEAANRAKGDFLANMSHELRTPMNGVLGMTSLLKDTPLNPEQRELLDTISTSGETLLLLLNDILDFSKIEAGQVALENIPFDIIELAQSTIRLLEPLASKKGIVCGLTLAQDIPAFVNGDPARVRQVITNLIGNAIKFTTAGSVRLSLSCDQVADDKCTLRFNIDDTGIGIKPEHLDKIFHKFTQADETTTRRFGGTGLGLTICKLLTEKMGGQIGVESTMNEGSRFWFAVPFMKVSAKETQVLGAAARHEHAAAQPLARADFSAHRILVVDDHPINLLFAKKLLQKFGCTNVDTVDNGADALRLLAAGRFDLVITDCQMPEMDGYEVSRTIRMRENAVEPRMPIVAMTANAMVGDREKCLDAGMDDYVSKPINADRLYRVLAAWLSNVEPETGETNALAPQLPVGERQPVDLEHLYSVLGDDMDERREIIGLFINLAEQAAQGLLENLHNNDNGAWKKAAHKLKGSAANFGAHGLADHCRVAEEACDADAVQKTTMFLAIRHALSEVKGFLQVAIGAEN